MNVTFAKHFRFSPDGVEILAFEPGTHDVSDRCANVAAEAGVLAPEEPEKKETPPKQARKAPEIAAASSAPETK